MKKSVRILVLAFALVMLLAVIPVGTYNSQYMELPEGAIISDPYDMVVDDEMNVYIADAGSNTVIVLDRYYKHKFTISGFTNEIGAPDSFSSPRGVYVTDNKYNG